MAGVGDDSWAIAECRIYRYRLPCTRLLDLKGSILNERQGLILRLTDAQGHEGFGETAPLPGFSRESLEQSLAQLMLCCQALAATPLDHAWCRWQGEYERFYRRLRNTHSLSQDVFPSVRMGLECAICELIHQRGAPPVQQPLDPAADATLAWCTLLSGNRAQILGKAHQLRDHPGLTQVKLKVGRQPPRDDARLLRELCTLLGDHVRFRLDANRQWSYTDAMDFAVEAPLERILYIEEPTPSLEASRQFSAVTGFGVALDETLQDPAFQLECFSELAALIVKPTLCGGLEKTCNLVRQARAWDLPIVISSSFESSLGIGQLAALAATLTPGQTAGLDTLSLFTQDLVRAPGPLLSTTPRTVLPLQQLPLAWQYSTRSPG